MQSPITSRQRDILTAIVESYIATGEPVSSGILAQSAFGHLSSATIRNEMAELSAAGLLDQPHTSAGRVPSPAAFRLYVSQIQTNQPRAELQSRIDTGFAGVAGTQALLERTSHILASLSSGVGVAIGAAATTDLLEHIHFSRLTDRRVLAVLVTRGGIVRDRVLALEQDLSIVQLETAANFLNQHFRGWNLELVRTELDRRIESERAAYQRLQDAIQLWSRTLPEGAATQQTVYIDGTANLIAMPEDRGRLREMLAALEEKQRLVELLNAYIHSTRDSVRVVFDLEEQSPQMAGLVLIAAPARLTEDNAGTVAVIGPRRMQYDSAMNAVSYISQVFDRLLQPPSP